MQCPHCGKAVEQLSQDMELKSCAQAWRRTLGKYKGERNVFKHEIKQIQEAIEKYDYESVHLALIGAGQELPGNGYVPANFVSLRRTFHPEKFDRFVNLGAQALERKRLAEATKQRLQVVEEKRREDEEKPVNKEEVKAKMKGILKSLRA